MKENANFLFLKQEDAIAAGVLDMKATIADCEKALAMFSAGEIHNPPKTSMMIEKNGEHYFKLNSMPVYLGGAVNRPGHKWAGESPANARTRKHPLGIDVMILSDPETVLPECIMDATLITAMRTSACTAIAIKHLVAKNAKTIAVIGAGVIGRTMMLALRDSDLSFEEIRLCDLDLERAKELATEYGTTISITPYDSTEAACRGADVVVTCTTTSKPIIRQEWIADATLLCQCGMNEFPAQVLLDADVVTTDYFEQMMSFPKAFIVQLYQEGKLVREEIPELFNMVAGKEAPRQSDAQRIMYVSKGLALLDVLIGDRIYNTAKEKGIGQTLALWDKPIWI